MATYRQRAGRWQAQIRRDGKCLSHTADTKAEAMAWARRTEAALDAGERRGEVQAGTLGELITRYATEAEPEGDNKRAVLAALIAELGDVKLKALTADRIITWGKARAGAGAGPVTIGIDLTYLRGVMEHARVVWRMPVPREPLEDARAALRHLGLVGRSRERDRRPLAHELAAILAHLEAHRGTIPMVDIVRFAIASAMRLGEICRLRWADLDAGRRVILVRDRKHPRLKQGNHMLVPLLDKAGWDALELILRQPRAGELIFPYREESISRAWQRACAACGVDDLHFHDLRREAASRLLEAGLAAVEVRKVTGHADLKMLLRYEALRPEDIAARYRPATPLRPVPDTGEPPAG